MFDETPLDEPWMSEPWMSEPWMSEPGMSELRMSELGISELRISELGIDDGECEGTDEVAPAAHPEIDFMMPDGVVSVWLSAVDVKHLSAQDRVRVLRGHARMVAHHQAGMFEAMMSIADEIATSDEIAGSDDGADMKETVETTVAELRAALCLTRRAAECELAFASAARDRIPSALAALSAGSIDLRRMRVLVDETMHLSEDEARAVVDRVIDSASKLTTGQLRAWVRRVCLHVNPEQAAARYEDALNARQVTAEMTEVGTATITASDLPSARVAAIMDRLTWIATGLRAANEERSLDQLRADVFLDLLDGSGDYQKGRGTVNIRVDLATLVGLNEDPIDLAGFGPVVADIGRQTIKRQTHSKWVFAVVDPDTGAVVHTGITKRRPTEAQRREVTARNPTCVFPGCRMPSTSCDLDHRRPWSEGGETTVDQLVPLCRRDHVVRHNAGWSHVENADGTHTWTSRLGMVYTTARAP